MARYLAVLALVLLPTCLFAQEVEDVVYLADGRVFRGVVVEEQTYPEPAITIRTRSGEELTFGEDEIARITRERIEPLRVSPSGTGRQMSDAAWEVNLLGLLQFGPYFRYHMSAGNGFYVSPHVRLGYAGLMYLFLDWWPEVGVGTSFLSFWPTGIGGNQLYGGPIVELMLLKADGTFFNGVGLMGNFGHRWYSETGSFWQLGVLGGAAYEINWDEITVVAMLEISWGADL